MITDRLSKLNVARQPAALQRLGAVLQACTTEEERAAAIADASGVVYAYCVGKLPEWLADSPLRVVTEATNSVIVQQVMKAVHTTTGNPQHTQRCPASTEHAHHIQSRYVLPAARINAYVRTLAAHAD